MQLPSFHSLLLLLATLTLINANVLYVTDIITSTTTTTEVSQPTIYVDKTPAYAKRDADVRNGEILH
ncbi:MAG: hypothetical protein M1812_007677 [Candelaria pacifica]|nr:MAG: hypothetical protein M1812_007677 [Candelaria pacifica]